MQCVSHCLVAANRQVWPDKVKDGFNEGKPMVYVCKCLMLP
jgi:hypothetical protein